MVLCKKSRKMGYWHVMSVKYMHENEWAMCMYEVPPSWRQVCTVTSKTFKFSRKRKRNAVTSSRQTKLFPQLIYLVSLSRRKGINLVCRQIQNLHQHIPRSRIKSWRTWRSRRLNLGLRQYNGGHGSRRRRRSPIIRSRLDTWYTRRRSHMWDVWWRIH